MPPVQSQVVSPVFLNVRVAVVDSPRFIVSGKVLLIAWALGVGLLTVIIFDKVSPKYNPPKDWIGKHAGSKVILDYIKKYQPKYVFCGHIHEGEGKAKIGKTEVYNLGVAGHKIINL